MSCLEKCISPRRMPIENHFISNVYTAKVYTFLYVNSRYFYWLFYFISFFTQKHKNLAKLSLEDPSPFSSSTKPQFITVPQTGTIVSRQDVCASKIWNNIKTPLWTCRVLIVTACGTSFRFIDTFSVFDYRRKTVQMRMDRMRLELCPIRRIDPSLSQAHWCQTV